MLSLLTLPRDVLYLIFKLISPADQLTFTRLQKAYYDELSQNGRLWQERYRLNELPKLQDKPLREDFTREYIYKGKGLIEEITFLLENKVKIMELFNGKDFQKASTYFNQIDTLCEDIKTFNVNLATVDKTIGKFNLLIAKTQIPAHRRPSLQIQFLTRLSDDWVDAYCEKYPQDDEHGVVNLAHLDLRNTELRELPSKIGKLCHLESLNLYDSKLKNIPDSIAQLTKLRQFLASGGNLKTFPRALLSCTALGSLSLMNMGIKDLPKEIGELKALHSLWLNDNNIRNCPVTLQSLKLLKELRLEGNRLKFYQPAEVKVLLKEMNIDLRWLIEHQQGRPKLTESEQEFYDLGQSLDRIRGQLQAIKLDDTEEQVDALGNRLSNISFGLARVKDSLTLLKQYRANQKDDKTPGDMPSSKNSNASQKHL